MKTFRVTYENSDGERAVLIDNVDLITAQAVINKWSNPDDPFFFMPNEKIEEEEQQ